MPAPEPVAAALRRALDGAPRPGGFDSLGARASVLETLDFEEAGDYQVDLAQQLKQKYLYLVRESPQQSQGKVETADASGLPSPKRVLFPLSSVRSGFPKGWQVGAGMQNFGNTCYLNSTLQALFHVSAFANWLVSDIHSDERCLHGDCIICGMRKTLADTQKSGGPVKPWQVYSKLRYICRHLTPGRQEDAHEFLRYLVEAMEKAYLSQFGSASQLDQYSKETTPLNQILGGYLRSVVRCLACGHVSTTFQHFQDLLVDARKASTIDEALDTFFSLERLEDLGYKCEFCNKKVSATKQFHIERAPMVLCIALKRFSITGAKLTKHVPFRPKFCLNKYLFNKKLPTQLEYRLVSIVTHLGQSQNCGHYTATGVGPAGNFHQFDDTCVREIPMGTVLNTNAYILFYELGTPHTNNANKINLAMTPTLSSSSIGETSPLFIGPVMPKNYEDKQPAIPLPAAAKVDLKNSMNGSKPKVTFMSLNFRDGENEPSNQKATTSTMSSTSNVMTNGTLKPSNESASTNGCSPSKNGIKNSSGDSINIYNNGTNKKPFGSDRKLNGEHTNGQNKSNGPIYKNGKIGESKTNGNSDSYDFKSSRKSEINGSPSVRPLVPYDSESSNHEDADDVQKPSTSQSLSPPKGWKVSRESPEKTPAKLPLGGDKPESMIKDKETVGQLQRFSHSGYGAPVSTWNGTHAQLTRHVFEDKKNELKRAADADDEMDRGRCKKMRFNYQNNNHNYKYNDRSNGNAFQETQNYANKWNGKDFRRFPNHRNNHHKQRHRGNGRFNNHYSRHHSNQYYHRGGYGRH